MKPYLYMISYGLSQTVVWILVSYLSNNNSIAVMFLFRNLVGFAISMVRKPVCKINRTTHKRWKMHLVRASAAFFGGLSIFYSVTKIPVADSVAITFLAPIFGSLLSIYFLKEKLTSRLVIKLIGGLIGVFVITGFNADGEWIGYAAAIVGALMTGLAYVSVKSLANTETPQDILSVSYLIMLPISGIFAATDWVTPNVDQLGWLIAIGLAFYMSQFLMTKAFSLAPASKILPIDYTRILFSSFLGYVFLNQDITLQTFIGSLIILLTSLIQEPKVQKVIAKKVIEH